MKTCFRALFPVLIVLMGLAGCAERMDLSAPEKGAVEEVLLRVLRSERGPVDTLPLAVKVTPEDEPSFFRRANGRERAAIYLPDGIEGLEVHAMRSKYYPSWRVLFYKIEDGQRVAPLTAAVVPIDGELSVVLHWRRAVRLADGTLRPDVRMRPGRGKIATNEQMTVAFLPAWDSR